MRVKLFEVRDRSTCMKFMGVNMNTSPPALGEMTQREYMILRYAGFGPQNLIMFVDINGSREAHYDTYGWTTPARTISAAHQYVTEHWDELKSGDVIDVEYILGETTQKKETEFL